MLQLRIKSRCRDADCAKKNRGKCKKTLPSESGRCQLNSRVTKCGQQANRSMECGDDRITIGKYSRGMFRLNSRVLARTSPKQSAVTGKLTR